MSKQMMWITILIALIVGAFGGYYYEKTKLTSQMMALQSSMQKQIDDVKMQGTQMMKAAPTGTTVTPTSTMMNY